MEEKLKLAGQAYGNGCTCSQAVFCAAAAVISHYTSLRQDGRFLPYLFEIDEV